MQQPSKTTWRLIITPSLNGATNMAIDESILEAITSQNAQPTLRLYSWEPACLSLGFAQPVSDVNTKELIKRGWDLVRRPTGGRAILHCDEITYAVIGPENDPRLDGGVLESYNKISQALLATLTNLNIPATAAPISGNQRTSRNNEHQNPVCFEVPSHYEITVNGKKLIGSAQARRKGGVLQHGSIPIRGDLTRILQVLQFQNEEALAQAKSRLAQRATTIEQTLGYTINDTSFIKAMIAAFQQTLNLEIVESELSKLELDRTDQLIREKYNNPIWTNRM